MIGRTYIHRRTATPLEGDRVELAVELSAPLTSTQGGRLLLEAVAAEQTGLPGGLVIERPVVERHRVELVIGPVTRGAVRLDALLAALGAIDTSLALPLAARIVADLARRLTALAAVEATRAFQPFHGHLTPSAVLLDASGTLQILGGGFVELTALLVPDAEAHAAAIAPEVRRGGAPSEQADVFSLGALCAAIFAGVTPREPIVPSEVLRGAPRGLVDLVSRALAAQPNERWSSPEVVAAGLEEIAAQEGLTPFTAEELGQLVAVSIKNARIPRGPAALEDTLRRGASTPVAGPDPLAELEIEIDLLPVEDEAEPSPARAQPARRRSSVARVVGPRQIEERRRGAATPTPPQLEILADFVGPSPITEEGPAPIALEAALAEPLRATQDLTATTDLVPPHRSRALLLAIAAAALTVAAAALYLLS